MNEQLPGNSWFFPVKSEFKVAKDENTGPVIFIEHKGDRIVLNDLVNQINEGGTK